MPRDGTSSVMAGLVPAIPISRALRVEMAGTSPANDRERTINEGGRLDAGTGIWYIFPYVRRRARPCPALAAAAFAGPRPAAPDESGARAGHGGGSAAAFRALDAHLRGDRP